MDMGALRRKMVSAAAASTAVAAAAAPTYAELCRTSDAPVDELIAMPMEQLRVMLRSSGFSDSGTKLFLQPQVQSCRC